MLSVCRVSVCDMAKRRTVDMSVKARSVSPNVVHDQLSVGRPQPCGKM